MKILVLNYEFPPLGGGASEVSYGISREYAKRGHDVTVVTMAYKGLQKHEEKDGMKIYRVPCLRSKKEMCYPWEQLSYILSAKRFLKKHLKDNAYDVNHTHFAIPTGVVALWAKKKFGLSYIITSHGSDVPNYNPDRFTLLHKFTKPMIRKILNNAKAAVAGSQFLADLGNKEIGSQTKYQVIREGFDAQAFVPAPKKKYIVSTGRLLPRKGFQYIIEAVSEEDLGYEVHICGDGPMMQELQIKAQKSKTKIVFHGWLDNRSEAYKNLLAEAEIYCLLSAKENASISLLEALAAGCAVITSNTSGCAETVGDAGIAVEPQNTTQLKKILGRLTQDPGKVSSLGAKARERILQAYSWEKNIPQYENLLRS